MRPLTPSQLKVYMRDVEAHTDHMTGRTTEIRDTAGEVIISKILSRNFTGFFGKLKEVYDDYVAAIYHAAPKHGKSREERAKIMSAAEDMATLRVREILEDIGSCPMPDEIKRRTAEIRDAWSPAEEFSRRGEGLIGERACYVMDHDGTLYPRVEIPVA